MLNPENNHSVTSDEEFAAESTLPEGGDGAVSQSESGAFSRLQFDGHSPPTSPAHGDEAMEARYD